MAYLHVVQSLTQRPDKEEDLSSTGMVRRERNISVCRVGYTQLRLGRLMIVIVDRHESALRSKKKIGFHSIFY